MEGACSSRPSSAVGSSSPRADATGASPSGDGSRSPPPPPDGSLKYMAAALFVNDALHGREKTVYNTNPTSLKCKFMYHKRRYRDFVTFMTLLHISLGLLESVGNYTRILNMYRMVEASFCLLYILDSMLVLKFIGRDRWIKYEVWTFILSIAMIIDIALVATGLNPMRYPFLRALRPAFFAARRRHLRACFISMFKSIGVCLPLVLILLCIVVTWSIFGWILFDGNKAPYDSLNHSEEVCSTQMHGDGVSGHGGSCNDYFRTFSSSMYQVWILLVKVNMPDIMMPYYNLSKVTSLYFVTFTVFTQFFFLRLILAASFSNYKKDYKERYRRRVAFRDVAMLKAFALLSEGASFENTISTQEIIRQPRGKTGFKKLSSSMTTNMCYVTLSSWRKMMRIARPDLKSDPWIYDLIFAASSNSIETVEQLEQNPSVTFQEFSECCHSVNLEVKKSVEGPMLRNRKGSFVPIEQVAQTAYRARAFLQWLVLETTFEYIMQFSLAVLSVSAIIFGSDRGQSSSTTLKRLDMSVVLLFSFTVLSSLVSRGRVFWLKVSNQLSFVVMCLIIILHFFKGYREEFDDANLDSSLSLLYVLVVLRSILFMRLHPAVTSTAMTIRLILPMLARIAIVYASVMYAFIMVGNSLFEGSLKDNPDLADTSFYKNHYETLNFSSFWGAALLLHQCMLGPQFPSFIEAVATASGWTKSVLYFGSYYIVVIVFMQNIVVAFILEAYVSKKSSSQKRDHHHHHYHHNHHHDQEIEDRNNDELPGRPSRLSERPRATSRQPPTQQAWIARMRRMLKQMLNSGSDYSLIMSSSSKTLFSYKAPSISEGGRVTFEFSRSQPHHELYDHVFHGDVLEAAKVKIVIDVNGSRGRNNTRVCCNGDEEEEILKCEKATSDCLCDNNSMAEPFILPGNNISVSATNAEARNNIISGSEIGDGYNILSPNDDLVANGVEDLMSIDAHNDDNYHHDRYDVGNGDGEGGEGENKDRIIELLRDEISRLKTVNEVYRESLLE